MPGKLSIGVASGLDGVGAPADDEPPQLDGPDWHKFHRGYEAVNRGDLDGVLAFLHPRIEWDMSRAFPDGPVYLGHAGVRRFFDDAMKLWDDFQLEIDELRELGEHVVVVGWWSGTGRHSRVPIRSPGAWVYRMRRGRADRMRFYRDRIAAVRSLEPRRAPGEAGDRQSL